MKSLAPTSRLRVLVSIINYKTADLTIQCVQSVLDDIEGQAVHVVVVDNASGDGSAEKIEAWIAGQPPTTPISFVRSDSNSGFSGGHNQGIGVAEAEFYLVLNSDALLRPGFFKAILAAAEAHPKAGLLAPRLEFDDGEVQNSCFRFPTPASELIRGADTGPVSKLLHRYDIPIEMPPAQDQIGWASFACILLRHDMVEAVGMMDEGYFLYFEDVAYCRKARKAGWTIAYVPDARAVHFRGGSGPVKQRARDFERLPAYYYASRTRFFYQAYGRLGLYLANALWLVGRGIANLRRLVGKPIPKANRAELRDIWTNALSPLGDRRAEGR